MSLRSSIGRAMRGLFRGPSETDVASAPAARSLGVPAARGQSRIKVRSDFFKGSESSRLTADWEPLGWTFDEALRWGLRRLRNRARDLARNEPYTCHYLNLLRNNVIGPNGIKLQALVRNNDGKLATAINDRIEAAFADWSRRASLDGRSSLTALYWCGIESLATDGEVLIRRWVRRDLNRYALALELIDPSLLDETLNREAREGSNEIRLGIEVDALGRRVAYHLLKRPTQGFSTPLGPHERVPASDIIHVFAQRTPNQTRGVTWLRSVMYTLRQIDAFADAAVIGARLGASKMGVLTPKGEDGPADPIGDEANPNAAPELDAEPGAIPVLPAGYELDTFDPGYPNTAYGEFVKAQLQRMSAGVSISYPSLGQNLEGVSYSSIRAGVLAERDVYRGTQRLWVEQVCEQVLDWFLDSAYLAGALTLDARPVDRFRASRWIGRGWEWVDPLKDVQASNLEVANGFNSRTRILAERGDDFDEILQELADEREAAAAKGIELSGDAKPVKDGKTGFGDDEPADKGTGRDVVIDAIRTRDVERAFMNGRGSHA